MSKDNIGLLKWFNFCYDFRPYVAIAILYFSQVSGSYVQGFAIFSIAAISSAILEVPTGILSDFIGRKKTVLFGAIASLLAVFCYGVASSFTLLAIGAILNGLARAFLSGNNNALLYDTLNDQGETELFSEKLGMISSMTEIALGISALLSGFAVITSLKLIMLASVIPQIIATIIALRLIEPSVNSGRISSNPYTHLKESWQAFTNNMRLRQISLAYIIDSGLEQANYDFKPAFNALIWPTWALGVARSLDSIFGFLGFQQAGKIVKKIGASKALFTQQIIGMLNRFVFIGFPNILSPLMLSLNAFIFGVSETANQTLLHNEFSDKQRATMGSLNSLASSLFYALIAFVIGLFADLVGPTKTLLILTGATVPLAFLYWNLTKKPTVSIQVN